MAKRRALLAALAVSAALCTGFLCYLPVRATREREARALANVTAVLRSLGVATEAAVVTARRLPGNGAGHPVVSVEYARPDGTTLASADLNGLTGELISANLPRDRAAARAASELPRGAIIDAAASALERTGVLNQASQWRLASFAGPGRLARVTWRAPDRSATVSVDPYSGATVSVVVLRRDADAVARAYAREYGWAG